MVQEEEESDTDSHDDKQKAYSISQSTYNNITRSYKSERTWQSKFCIQDALDLGSPGPWALRSQLHSPSTIPIQFTTSQRP